MFTRLGIQNFKAWKGSHAIELKPLTLLLGVNSAGKTTLLQPLLLLKQTAESPDRQQALNLGGQPGDILHLGTMEDVLSAHDKRAAARDRRRSGACASARARDLAPALRPAPWP